MALANPRATLIRNHRFVPYGQIHADDVLLSPGIELSVNNILNDLLTLRYYTAFTLKSSTWTTIYPIATGNHGWIKVNTQANGLTTTAQSSMVSSFFERTDRSYASLTLMAQSGNAAQGALNTTNSSTGSGTMQFSLQLNGNNIQAKSVGTSLPVAVRVTTF